MRGKVSEQRIKPVIGVSIFVEANSADAMAAFHQLGRRIVMLEIDDHFISPQAERSREPGPTGRGIPIAYSNDHSGLILADAITCRQRSLSFLRNTAVSAGEVPTGVIDMS
jgi:hypothetical protein